MYAFVCEAGRGGGEGRVSEIGFEAGVSLYKKQ